MSEIKYTELDFLKVKENLKTFLKGQDKFKDYNFDGAGISILLDILAYNTAYNGFYLNMLASEMFLDSASMRESVVSRAKHLGYTPSSTKSLSALVDVIVEYSQVPDSLLISNTYEFYTTLEGSRYTFTPRTSMFLEPYLGSNSFIARNLELIEGKRLTYSWTVDNESAIKQRFIIPSDTVDLSTVKVTVQKSQANSAQTIFTEFKDITTLSPNDEVYFIQAAEANKYEIVFGDGIIGKALETGNIVKVEYVSSTGDGAEGAKVFTVNAISAPVFLNTLPGKVKIITKTSATGYVERESIESIKITAPRSYDTQNRAVTKSDYETILKRDIPNIEHLRVWGGEDNIPPEYGKVFCAIKPISGYALNDTDKQNLINSYIKPRNVIPVEVVLVDPEYVRLVITSKVNYFSTKTTKSAEDIKNLVLSNVREYRTKYLVGFDSDFRHSRLTRLIDSVDSSIESNITQVNIKQRFVPAFDTKLNYTVKLNNQIDTGDAKNNVAAINSTPFIYKGTRVVLGDDGAGNLVVYYLINDSKVVLNQSVGTVNYATGEIKLVDLIIDSIPDNKNYVDLIITPRENDIITFRNQLLMLDNEDIHVSVVDLNKLKLS